jgi:trehalose synthase
MAVIFGSAASPRRVSLKRKALEDYRELVGDDLIAEVRELGSALRGLRVLELSATATGGGVAEMLSSLVPLKRDLGIDGEWRVIAGDPGFFEVTKRLHNGMQGMDVELSGADRRDYLRHNRSNAAALDKGSTWDVVVVHDPQPAAVCAHARDRAARWVWRCHIDSSTPHPPVWDFLRPFVEAHDLAVFTLGSFVPPDLALPTALVLPAIDPLTSKNQELPAYLARQTVAALGVDLSRPLLLQVSRFDPWKDPLGVVEVWRRVRETFPSLQLALVGSMATDDPEGWRVYGEIELETAGEPACLLFTDQMGVASHEVNAFQRVADVAIQKSTREGFGLVVAETLWKGTAMVAGRAGGIPVQLEDGVGGYLAGSVDEFAERTAELLEDPVGARTVGAAGAERVRQRFLLPRLLRDHLSVLRRVAG